MTSAMRVGRVGESVRRRFAGGSGAFSVTRGPASSCGDWPSRLVRFIRCDGGPSEMDMRGAGRGGPLCIICIGGDGRCMGGGPC